MKGNDVTTYNNMFKRAVTDGNTAKVSDSKSAKEALFNPKQDVKAVSMSLKEKASKYLNKRNAKIGAGIAALTGFGALGSHLSHKNRSDKKEGKKNFPLLTSVGITAGAAGAGYYGGKKLGKSKFALRKVRDIINSGVDGAFKPKSKALKDVIKNNVKKKAYKALTSAAIKTPGIKGALSKELSKRLGTAGLVAGLGIGATANLYRGVKGIGSSFGGDSGKIEKKASYSIKQNITKIAEQDTDKAKRIAATIGLSTLAGGLIGGSYGASNKALEKYHNKRKDAFIKRLDDSMSFEEKQIQGNKYDDAFIKDKAVRSKMKRDLITRKALKGAGISALLGTGIVAGKYLYDKRNK